MRAKELRAGLGMSYPMARARISISQQKKILRLRSKGMSYQRIADTLGISIRTALVYSKSGIVREKPQRDGKRVAEILEHFCKCCNGGIVRFERYADWTIELTSECDQCGQVFDRSAYAPVAPRVSTNKPVIGHKVGAFLTDESRRDAIDNEREYEKTRSKNKSSRK